MSNKRGVRKIKTNINIVGHRSIIGQIMGYGVPKKSDKTQSQKVYLNKSKPVKTINLSKKVDIESDNFMESCTYIINNFELLKKKVKNFLKNSNQNNIYELLFKIAYDDSFTKTERIIIFIKIADDYIKIFYDLQESDPENKEISIVKHKIIFIKNLIENLVAPQNKELLDDNLFFLRYKYFSKKKEIFTKRRINM